MTFLMGKLAQLTDELFAVSRRGALVWKPGTADGGYTCEIGELGVALERFTGDDGLPAVAVTLLDRTGRAAQRFTDSDFGDLIPDDDTHRSYWELLTELHEMARWSAEGLHTLIDEFINALTPMIGTDEEEAEEATPEDQYTDFSWSDQRKDLLSGPRIRRSAA